MIVTVCIHSGIARTGVMRPERMMAGRMQRNAATIDCWIVRQTALIASPSPTTAAEKSVMTSRSVANDPAKGISNQKQDTEKMMSACMIPTKMAGRPLPR